MSGASDLGKLLALRSLREERAKAAVSVAAARLRDASRAVSDVEVAIERHEHETDWQEQRFLEAMQIKPLPSGEFGRRHELLGVSDQRREALIGEREKTSTVLDDCERELAAAQAEWRHRLFERDRLAEAESRLRTADQARAEAVVEQEAEEMSADRVRMSC